MDAGIVVLVTGGTGLVGRAVQAEVEKLSTINETWIFVGSADADLTDLAATRRLFEMHRPTHVLHLAARVGGLFKQLHEPVEFFRANSSMNDNVLACAHDVGVTKVISMLSTCIFPDNTTYPITESMLHLGPPHASNIGYAIAKRNLDILSQCYVRQHRKCFTCVIPTNVFGPHDNFHLQDAHVIPALVHKCYLAKQRGDASFVVGGSGTPLRQFIFSHDLAKLLLWAIRFYDDTSEPLILSVDDELSIGDVAVAIAKAMDFHGTVKFDATQPDGQMKKTASNAKLRRLVPAFQFTSFQDGIAATVEWFIKHYHDCRK
ncbi:hypothetical protein H310_12188 [Aphanomyces invadans]|uniref:GDP-L-fucose synthase n=1 Tax=Aphanomyces invadans TaxID=157072 RepID=A0A024TI60_9STRA|nr:hypothetical protein H310_12188 [Aphanomyces invadans]ETV93835.1 hypothetical protein H310_12188 [Aphanomyces invadans]|eukprot:XP_008877395.1 hypothetical protein H310_12188 [Aphanomyces invadans]